ncbi:MAG: hypothetical protein ABW163_03340, partial [Luteimonas sp.]
ALATPRSTAASHEIAVERHAASIRTTDPNSIKGPAMTADFAIDMLRNSRRSHVGPSQTRGMR